MISDENLYTSNIRMPEMLFNGILTYSLMMTMILILMSGKSVTKIGRNTKTSDYVVLKVKI